MIAYVGFERITFSFIIDEFQPKSRLEVLIFVFVNVYVYESFQFEKNLYARKYIPKLFTKWKVLFKF